RSRRVTAERTVRDYATIAAWELATRSDAVLNARLDVMLGQVTGGLASSPYDRLPPLELVDAAAGQAPSCGPRDGGKWVFRIDLRDRSLVTIPAVRSSDEQRRLRDTVLADAGRPGTAGARYHALWIPGDAAGRVVVYGLRAAQSGATAIPGAAIAAYGLVTCARAMADSLLGGAMAGAPLLPSPLLSGLSNDSVLSIAVTTQSGDTLYRSAAPESSPFEAATALGGGGLLARVTLRRGAIERLAVAPPQAARLPLLLGLLVLTGSLAVVGVLQLRREHELARLRSDFTSSVSHELRTPLAQILLFGETLSLGRARSDEERRQAAGTIVQEARRLMHMVDNVLHLSRLERGVPAVRPAPVVLAPELARIADDFRRLPAAAGMELRTRLDPEVAANVDAGALRQIVLNLLENAGKYAPGAPVTLGLERNGSEAKVWVEDRGPGLADEDLERIWLPFTRGAAGHQASSGGSGIGLAVVRALAQAQGGTATAFNQEGRCRFTVTLPLIVTNGSGTA
ncbi:MAG TPA: HAMP domain-containing sensor histidine kinase, partial [Gemmatimonadales bacterium]|nr:HAMP domain-containing sensor histidine kinase [Gemmatimonadales bacterium]